MGQDTTPGIASPLELPTPDGNATPDRWQPPTLELICLACEISAYAPDGDLPLL